MKNLITIPLSLCSMGVIQAAERPNILFAIADDISYPYMSAYGTKGLTTPAFDEVARRGVVFNNGYVTSPGSSPSRASILTGEYTWEIEEGGTHGSAFPTHLVTYTDLLEQAGYHVGFTGKGWSPGNWKKFRKRNPAGAEYNKIKLTPPFKGGYVGDYTKNFETFLDERDTEQPFCFWYGGKEAHRGYEKGSGVKSGKRLEDAVVPPFLPDTEEVRGDILDFYLEVEWFDKHLGNMLRILEQRGELDNTLIVVTADNGMPFPNAKASGYDAGVHVPLAICWGNKLKCKKVEDTPVSSIDFAATFLDVAGVESDETRAMTSRSLRGWLEGERGAKLPDEILYARERHAAVRYDNLGYPIRAIRRGDMLYIHNFEPTRNPAGDPLCYDTKNGMRELVTSYGDIDGSPSKSELIERQEEPTIAPYFKLATAKRPHQMLFNLKKDPACMYNLATDTKYSEQLKFLKDELFRVLKITGDTRLTTPEVWDAYHYYGKMREYPQLN